MSAKVNDQQDSVFAAAESATAHLPNEDNDEQRSPTASNEQPAIFVGYPQPAAAEHINTKKFYGSTQEIKATDRLNAGVVGPKKEIGLRRQKRLPSRFND